MRSRRLLLVSLVWSLVAAVPAQAATSGLAIGSHSLSIPGFGRLALEVDGTGFVAFGLDPAGILVAPPEEGEAPLMVATNVLRMAVVGSQVQMESGAYAFELEGGKLVVSVAESGTWQVLRPVPGYSVVVEEGMLAVVDDERPRRILDIPPLPVVVIFQRIPGD